MNVISFFPSLNFCNSNFWGLLFLLYISSIFLHVKQSSFPKSYFNISLEGTVQMHLTENPLSGIYHNIHSSAKEICSSNIWAVELECTPELSDTAACSAISELELGMDQTIQLPIPTFFWHKGNWARGEPQHIPAVLL